MSNTELLLRIRGIVSPRGPNKEQILAARGNDTNGAMIIHLHGIL